MIELICQQCGKHYFRTLHEAKDSKYCSLDCLNKSKIGKPLSKAWRRKISASLMGNPSPFKGQHHSDGARAKLAKAHIGKSYLTEKGREVIIQANINKDISKESRRLFSLNTKIWRARIKLDPERNAMFIARQRESNKENWQDPEFVARMLSARRIKPTKPERCLDNILVKYFPYYQYNGDGRLGVTLGGLTPDFVNVNGKKEVIEVFGDYYHSPEILGDRWNNTELGKMMVYNSLGWRCLVIWEHELKELTEEEIITKIKTFQRKKYTQKKVIRRNNVSSSRF